MAKVQKRIWLSRGATGHRVKKVAWGYTLQVNGKQERKFSGAWTKDDAKNALAEFQLGLTPKPSSGGMTFREAVERYLQAKSRKKSIKDDERHLAALTAYFGADTPLAAITPGRISAWKAERLGAVCPRTRRPYSVAAINRPMAALRHLLRLAHEEWEALASAPKMRMEKEPEGRVRWLGQHAPDEEERLLAACRERVGNSQVAQIVTIALETGMRKAEVLGLTWDRVDLSRGVIRLETTKSEKRREIPMRQAVYDILSGMPEPRHGRVWRHRHVNTAFKNAVEAAGLRDFVFHDCRHHFASWFVMRGGSLQALKEILGHADLKMTVRYAHLSQEHLRGEIAKTERRATPAANGTEAAEIPTHLSTRSAHSTPGLG